MAAVFTVYFEDPFWVALLEIRTENELRLARQVFGAEPGNAELLNFMLGDYSRLLEAAVPAVPTGAAALTPSTMKNPKRASREARREMKSGVSTKARIALKAAQEALGQKQSQEQRRCRSEESRQRFVQRSEKRRQKRAGH